MTRQALRTAFLAYRPSGAEPADNSLNQALIFLTNAGLLDSDGAFLEASPLGQETFELGLLSRLRARQLGLERPEDAVDALYLGLIDSLFVQPNRHYVDNLHAEANALIQERRRTNAHLVSLDATHLYNWGLVCRFLGLGWPRREQRAFYCCYAPRLLQDIVRTWDHDEGTLYDFLLHHVHVYLPFRTRQGGLASALLVPLRVLSNEGYIELGHPRQDLGAPVYGGFQTIRILRREVYHASSAVRG